MDTFYVGIDLGGTNIKGGVVDSSGKVVHFQSIETEGEHGRDHVLDRMGNLVGMARLGSAVCSTRIAAPAARR